MNVGNDFWENSGAVWICQAGAENSVNLYLQFVRKFEIKGIKNVCLHITASSQYAVAINGNYIGRGPAVSYKTRYYYHTYNIPEDILQEGENCISVLVYHDGESTETIPGFRYGKPGLLACIQGRDWRISSDTDWLVRRAPCYSSLSSMVCQWGNYKEYYHGDKDDEWRLASYEHSTWEHAVAVAPPISPDFALDLVLLDVKELASGVARPIRITGAYPNLGHIGVKELDNHPSSPFERRYEISVEQGEPFSMPAVVFDFGKILVGFPEIAIEGGPCSIEVWYGETMDLYRLDAVHLPENGIWRAFQRRAFRFLQLKFIAIQEIVTIKHVLQNTFQYPFNSGSMLQTSDKHLNRIMDVSIDTLQANTSYHYEDCPIREQALWVMDMRIMGLMNTYVFGNHELNAKCIRQIFSLQREDGGIPATGPRGNNFYIHDFLFHLVASLKEHFQHTGDEEIVKELHPRLEKLHQYVVLPRAQDGLLDSDLMPGVWIFLDWNEKIPKAGKTTVLNSLYVIYLDDMAQLSRIAGECRLAEFYTQEAQRVRRRIHELFFLTDKQIYCDTWRNGELLPVISQQSNLAAILAGVPSESQSENILSRIMSNSHYQKPIGPSSYLLIFEALAKTKNFRLIERMIHEYWGAMLDRGATTWWEIFDADSPSWVYPHPFLGNCPMYEKDWAPVSCCHAWSSVPGYVIPRYLLGIDLSNVHKGQIIIQPDLDTSPEWAIYKLPMKGGMLHLKFFSEKGHRNVHVISKPAHLDVVIEGETPKAAIVNAELDSIIR